MKKLKVLILLAILIIVFTLTQTALADNGPEYILEDPCADFEPFEDSQIYCGVHKDTGYRIEVPANWNGDLLMWAHGYRMNSEYLWVDDPPFREWLVANGYAWAASSFSTSKLDVTDGMKDTKALVVLFNEMIGEPDHIYLSGQSMGGAITVSSIEQWPDLYDGGMPTCGALAVYEGLNAHFDYYVLSNALAGMETVYPIPEDYATATYPSVIANLEAVPGTYPYILNQQGTQLKNAFELLSGGERPVYDQAFLFWFGVAESAWGFSLTQFFMDIDAAGVNGVYVDNWSSIYQFDTDPALSLEELAINESVLRVERDPQAMHPNGLANIPVNNGKISVPILSLHNLGDLLVPFSVEQIYATRAANEGNADLLVQRAIRDFQHCSFTQSEYVEAFMDLVNWVENGIKPTGDDILNPAAVSDPYFGCQFTRGDRDYAWISPMLAIPACP